MKTFIDIFKENGMDSYAAIPFEKCRVTRPYLLDRIPDFHPEAALVFLLPYYTGTPDNISAYAAGRDYHQFMKRFLKELTEGLSAQFPNHRFFGFSDHSPIDERLAAVKAGLGVFGKNGLLLTEKYSSFVFLGEVITDLPAGEMTPQSDNVIRSCIGCGACLRACPTGILRGESDVCLSALTQKKGELSDTEKDMIRRFGSAWGCDVCQNVCPYTKAALEAGTLMTPVSYFYEDRILHLSEADLEAMDEEHFLSRAFSWRGRSTIQRNLKILEEK